jgi:hypothetical protein
LFLGMRKNRQLGSSPKIKLIFDTKLRRYVNLQQGG